MAGSSEQELLLELTIASSALLAARVHRDDLVTADQIARSRIALQRSASLLKRRTAGDLATIEWAKGPA